MAARTAEFADRGAGRSHSTHLRPRSGRLSPIWPFRISQAMIRVTALRTPALLGLLLIVAAAGRAGAQTALTLDDAIREALARNRLLQAARAGALLS